MLINFWTYTCINWLRQLPYVRAWAEKYQDQGLVVIGCCSPTGIRYVPWFGGRMNVLKLCASLEPRSICSNEETP